jgi:hypothetical protein
MEPTVTVSGDAPGGFIVEIHDGERFGCFPVIAADAEAARAAALEAFSK